MGHIHPRMRNRRCSNCGHEFCLWFHRYPFKYKRARMIVLLWNAAVWVAGILLVTDLYKLIANPSHSALYLLYQFLHSLILTHLS